MPDGSWRETLGKTDLGKILQEIVWQSQRPISKMRLAAVQFLSNASAAKPFGEWGS